jgi:small subunit ribosomal protein S16
MVRIRLRRVGKRKQPVYRIVVADQRNKRDGRFIEIIGQYKPLSNPSEINVDADKALEWLRKGASPSDAVVALMKRTGVWTTFVADKGPPPKKVKKRKETAKREAAEAAAKAEAAANAPQEAPPAPDATGEPAPDAAEAAAAPAPETAPENE